MLNDDSKNGHLFLFPDLVEIFTIKFDASFGSVYLFLLFNP